MSDKLYQLLCRRFPPTCRGYKRISIYPPCEDENPTWIERIHLNLVEKEFLDIKESLVKSEEIEGLAKEIFDDIPFRFYKNQEEGNIIYFAPEGIDNYNQKYFGHFIEIHEPLIIPKITISTGNRGSIDLHQRQRKKYFKFVENLYDLCINKTKTLRK